MAFDRLADWALHLSQTILKEAMKKVLAYLGIGLLSISFSFAQDQDSIIADSVTQTTQEPEVETAELTSDVFHNVSAKGTPGGAKITWSLDYSALDQLDNHHIVIKYNTKIGAKRDKKGMEGSEWKFTKPMDISTVKHELKGLADAEKYVFKVGLFEGSSLAGAKEKDAIVWSDKGKFKSDRQWGVLKMLMLLGSLGLFIFGMKIMSEGLQQTSGSRLRKIMASMTKNRFLGVLSGFGTTCVVQSSSVTTVMTVSFVNAGLMTLRESAGVMMGANIGTTITAWLVLLLGFKVSISSYALMIIALGAPFMFFRSNRGKSIANIVLGFSILFIGLHYLKEAVPSLDADSPLVQFFVNYKDIPVVSTLMFVALGALVTIVIQSSSAAMTLTMAMVAKGIIPFEVACAMILGENIGTTITAEIASLIGNVHAKRSARIHSLFNVVGVTWMVLIFPFALKGVATLIDGDPFSDPNAANTGLAIFHTAFNTANVFVLIWFVPFLVKIATRTVKSRGDSDEEFRLEYIEGTMMSTPELSILEAKKEVSKFGTLVQKQTGFIKQLLYETEKKKADKLLLKVKKYEEITDRVETEIANYLTKAAEGEMSESTSIKVRGMLSMISDMERIGDINYQMSKMIERKNELKIWFAPEQRDRLVEYIDILDGAYENMLSNLNSDYEGVTIQTAREHEDKINRFRDDLLKKHLRSIEKGEYKMDSGMIYRDLFSSVEKIGDHVINVTEAAIGEA